MLQWIDEGTMLQEQTEATLGINKDPDVSE